MPAFYGVPAREFISDDRDRIIGILTSRAGNSFFQQLNTQTRAWVQEIEILQRALAFCTTRVAIDTWSILLEFPIPRRGKRIDALLLIPGCIIVMEFKCGSNAFDRASMVQLEDYCLDLQDFHRESRGFTLVPFLIATHARDSQAPAPFSDCVQTPWTANEQELGSKLVQCVSRHSKPEYPIDLVAWDQGAYEPTPTIIEAARALYAGNNVREIARCHAGVENLTETSNAVLHTIDAAKRDSRKLICFVTGVPGAGKTLAGLNVVHNHGSDETEVGVFLSGNGPLVKVLTAALARDHRDRTGQSMSESKRRVTTFIQNVHRFIEEYFASSSKIPKDQVVIFDEAQRAWNADQSRRKFDRDFSEPEIMLEIMDRHMDWSVIVALVGVGQEINRGEAGLGEWGRALNQRFSHWRVVISPDLMVGSQFGASLFSEAPLAIELTSEPALHLSVSLRSYKAERLTKFTDALLKPDPILARRTLAACGDYPIVLTRSLDAARFWLRRRQRGTRRTGLVASSGARRLLAYGLDVTTELDVENWFLNPSSDVRSSDFLEVPATEFGIQGLELDWIGLCWGGDLIPDGGTWQCRRFRGTRWEQVCDSQTRQYSVNKYRVLLTRAREGFVIWVPRGRDDDPTQSPALYNQTADFLLSCGIPLLWNGLDHPPAHNTTL